MHGPISTFALMMLLLPSPAGPAPAQEIGRGLVVALAGGPESGKSTQAALIRKLYNIPVIAIEDLIKENPSIFKQGTGGPIGGYGPGPASFQPGCDSDQGPGRGIESQGEEEPKD